MVNLSIIWWWIKGFQFHIENLDHACISKLIFILNDYWDNPLSSGSPLFLFYESKVDYGIAISVFLKLT